MIWGEASCTTINSPTNSTVTHASVICPPDKPYFGLINYAARERAEFKRPVVMNRKARRRIKALDR